MLRGALEDLRLRLRSYPVLRRYSKEGLEEFSGLLPEALRLVIEGEPEKKVEDRAMEICLSHLGEEMPPELGDRDAYFSLFKEAASLALALEHG
jgi:hypothetical protein